jgi:hypothetical protein
LRQYSYVTQAADHGYQALDGPYDYKNARYDGQQPGHA